MLLNCILMLGLGMNFTDSHLINKYHTSFENLLNGATIYVVFMFFLLLCTGAMGIFISIDRLIPSWAIGCYSVVLFFFAGIPLLVQGGALLEIDKVTPEMISTFCSYEQGAY